MKHKMSVSGRQSPQGNPLGAFFGRYVKYVGEVGVEEAISVAI